MHFFAANLALLGGGYVCNISARIYQRNSNDDQSGLRKLSERISFGLLGVLEAASPFSLLHVLVLLLSQRFVPPTQDPIKCQASLSISAYRQYILLWNTL
jgi:hypothetical protein